MTQESTDDALRQHYRITINVKGKKSLRVGIPYEVVEREARRKGLTVEEFLETHQAVANYDSFDGVLYQFEPVEGQNGGNGNQPK